MRPRRSKPSLTIALILFAGLGSLVFSVCGGILLYRNTKALIEAEQWVEHSQEVLGSLQSASQRLDRLESNLHLFTVTRREDQLASARSAAAALGVASVHIRSLVFDSPAQIANVTRLGECSQALGRELDQIGSSDRAAQSTILRCRDVLSHMSEQEREKLKARTAMSQKKSQQSVLSEAEAGLACLAVLTVLFGLLLRDAISRDRLGEEAASANRELAATVQMLEERAIESRLLTTVRDELQLCTDLEQVYTVAARGLARLVPESVGSFSMINNSRHLLETVSSWGDAPASSVFEPSACCALRSGRLRWREPQVFELHCTHFTGEPKEHYLCLPLVAHGETLGIVNIAPDTLEQKDLVRRREESVRQVAELTAMTVAALQLRQKLEHQSIRDPLTGLFNRHFMQVALDRELARSERSKNPLSVFMLDVDHFKQFNDRFGHATGDVVLKEIAQTFLAHLRTEDMICRYGGEEFTIILPDTPAEAAFFAAERIRKAVAELQVVCGPVTHSDLRISIGVALYPEDGTAAEDLLKKADAALYRAKNEGRNQVVLA